jgi:hypothetical protein
MTSLHGSASGKGMKIHVSGSDRREHRRHDLEPQGISVDRVDSNRRSKETLGELVDISAGGVRIRTADAKFRTDNQVRVRLELPAYAGICPFVDTAAGHPQPKREWTGWLTISRVLPVDGNKYDVAGRLMDMEDLDRGMLSLYLSTQPLAA